MTGVPDVRLWLQKSQSLLVSGLGCWALVLTDMYIMFCSQGLWDSERQNRTWAMHWRRPVWRRASRDVHESSKCCKTVAIQADSVEIVILSPCFSGFSLLSFEAHQNQLGIFRNLSRPPGTEFSLWRAEKEHKPWGMHWWWNGWMFAWDG